MERRGDTSPNVGRGVGQAHHQLVVRGERSGARLHGDYGRTPPRSGSVLLRVVRSVYERRHDSQDVLLRSLPGRGPSGTTG